MISKKCQLFGTMSGHIVQIRACGVDNSSEALCQRKQFSSFSLHRGYPPHICKWRRGYLLYVELYRVSKQSLRLLFLHLQDLQSQSGTSASKMKLRFYWGNKDIRFFRALWLLLDIQKFLTLDDNQGRHIRMSNCNLIADFLHCNFLFFFFNWFDPNPVHTVYIWILLTEFWRWQSLLSRCKIYYSRFKRITYSFEIVSLGTGKAGLGETIKKGSDSQEESDGQSESQR